MRVLTQPYPVILRHRDEKYFKNELGEEVLFPSLADAPSIHLSVVVPAFNEEERCWFFSTLLRYIFSIYYVFYDSNLILVPPMLDECLEFLEKREDFKYEIIIVSDGSTDSTVSVAKNYSNKYGSEKIRVLDLSENRGKGGAVRLVCI